MQLFKKVLLLGVSSLLASPAHADLDERIVAGVALFTAAVAGGVCTGLYLSGKHDAQVKELQEEISKLTASAVVGRVSRLPQDEHELDAKRNVSLFDKFCAALFGDVPPENLKYLDLFMSICPM